MIAFIVLLLLVMCHLCTSTTHDAPQWHELWKEQQLVYVKETIDRLHLYTRVGDAQSVDGEQVL